MKIKLLSDLHLELYDFDFSYDGEDIMILAGNIHSIPYILLKLINKYIEQNKNVNVIYIAGNTDYYHNSIDNIIKYWKSIKLERFYFLNNNSVVIDNIRFFGCTLWTDFNKKDKLTMMEIPYMINDYQKIKGIKTKYILKLHTESIKKMKKTIENSLEKLVIITHHLPSIKSIQNRYTNYLVNGTIYSELDCIFSDKIILYCHGHINSNVDYNINGTRVICNTKIIQNNRQGYISKDQENLDFNPNYVITL